MVTRHQARWLLVGSAKPAEASCFQVWRLVLHSFKHVTLFNILETVRRTQENSLSRLQLKWLHNIFSVSPAFYQVRDFDSLQVFSSGEFLNSYICSRHHIQICLTDQFTSSIFCDFTNNFFIQTLLARLCWQHTRVNVWQGRCNGSVFFCFFFWGMTHAVICLWFLS